MDVIFLISISGLLWVQAWQFFGRYKDHRTIGLFGFTISILLIGVLIMHSRLDMVVYSPPGLGNYLEPTTVFLVFIAIWTVYSALVAGVATWNMDTRILGHYGLFLSLASAIFAVYFFLGDRLLDNGNVIPYTWLLGTVASLLSLTAGCLCICLSTRSSRFSAPYTSSIRNAMGYTYLISSTSILVLGGALILGINPQI